MHPPSRSLIVFDAETTGTDKRRDQIIELCAQFGLESGAPCRIWRFRPTIPISPGAQAVHGITMDDLEGCPGFAEVASEVRAVFERAEVLVGYNVAFDIDILQEELRRAGSAPLDLADKKIIDAFRLWQQCEPRSLQDAHRRFVGDEFEAAHSARADVEATGRVLEGMLRHFGLPGDWAEVARVCEPERAFWIGPSRHVRWDEAGRAVLGFGKHRGRPLGEIAGGRESGYLEWILGADFPPHVREICERALELDPEPFEAWLRETYGTPPEVATAA